MLYPPFNQPMSQFEVFRVFGFDVITVIDPSRWDGFYGFRRVVARIPSEP